MNQRLIIGSLLASLSLGCPGGGSTGGGSGGRAAGSGGSAAGTGGSAAGTGGAAAGTGGSAAGTGGSAAGTGGAAAGTGGSAAGTGGSAAGTGGAAAGTGGAGTGGRGGGTAGATGSGGRGGTTGTGGATGTGGGGVATNQSVLERNKNPSRDGHFIQPTITKAAAATMMADTTFNTAATFTGNVAASPVYLDGTGGGLFIIPTASGDVIARRENGMMAWTRSIGAPATASIGCSSFATTAPLGILSTPAIDAQSRTIYVAGITGNASGVMAQIASAINADDGTVKSGWPVNVGTAASFDPKIHNQRSALSLVNGILYVPYAGYVGDCGSYRGRVVAINTATPTTVGQWSTSDAGGGIWAPGGLASDGTSVYATTGNFVPLGSAPATHGDSEQVTRVTGMGTKADFFYPSNWSSMDTGDADFGSVNPMLITVPGATPSKIIAALAKDGRGYLLDADQLRGTASGSAAGGQKAMVTLATGNVLFGAPASYRTAMGTYIVITANMGAAGCPGGATGRQVVAVRIAPSPLAATVAWCAAIAGGPTSPIATTTDGTSDAIVWYTTNNQLRGVDGDSGAMIYAGTTACGGTIQKWTSPIAVKGRIVAAANGRFCAWGVPGSLTQAQAAPNKASKHKRKLAAASSVGLW